MTGRKPRCELSFSRRVLIIAADRLYTMATAAAAAASLQLPGGRTRWRNRNRTRKEFGPLSRRWTAGRSCRSLHACSSFGWRR